jgi:hypothetical protein
MGYIIEKVTTMARVNFDFAMDDVKLLLKLHDQQSGRRTGKPDRNLEVYKRAGIILTVTAWEAYIEDIVSYVFEQRLKEAESPDEFPDVFRSTINSWLAKKYENKPEKRRDVKRELTISDWKKAFREKFKKSIRDNHNPNSRNIRNLTVQYLGMDLTQSWKWQKTTSQQACRRLDDLIYLRGELVHRGKDIFETRTGATRTNLKNAIKLVRLLADCTDKAIGV